MILLWKLFLPLLMTLIAEVPAGMLILRKKKAFLPLTVINTVTNIGLNLLLVILCMLSDSEALYFSACAAGETAVWLSEGLYISATCDEKKGRALALSALLNIFSLTAGYAVYSIYNIIN